MVDYIKPERMGTAVLLLPALALGACAGSSKKSVKPNIIVSLADDLGYGDVSAYGASTISTPNMDCLAHGGVCFINGYATSATSTPSRYALMTEMYPWRNNKDARFFTRRHAADYFTRSVHVAENALGQQLPYRSHRQMASGHG